jgi:secondary thiamine-phosphate synthase enzyme
MKIIVEEIIVQSTTQIEFIDITNQIQEVIDNTGIREGHVLVFAPHTTMSVAINHNENMLMQDFMRMLYRVVPVDDQYSHDLFELRRDRSSDGRSNGHSHCKALLLGTNEMVPLSKGKLLLSSLQSIFAVDFDGARERNLIVQVVGM